ncbi:hypothetical protein V6N11_061107 [Hibiscus sabdariffa]|uniref:Reverse transcriptase Ty1/copia-type domain-containing protein n=1 Tax=Hibiscus sabdariffa TaxID=183260 RepID=A0ABR2PIT6_9ROSI
MDISQRRVAATRVDGYKLPCRASFLHVEPSRASKDKFEKHMDGMLDVGCLVLTTITLELQKQHEYVGYALETDAFTLNRVPSKSVQKTPHEMWIGKSPNMSFMRIWGCKAYVEHQMSTKLEPKSQKCTFVGYPKETKGYYFYNENKVFVARTRVFLEKEFLTNQGKDRNIELKEVQQQVIEPEVEEVSQAVEENSTDLETQPLRRSTRERHKPRRYGFLVTTHGDVILVDQDESKTYQEAESSPDSEKWLEAMRSEIDSMSDNQVWTLVEPPEWVKPIGGKWVFKKKTDMDGNVQTYKGRLVAKGFQKIHGVDYDETFSPVAMFKSIRIFLVIAAFHDYEIWQMDVKTAFLNGKLEEDVYMTQPEGFVTPENARKVCKLQRSIYGLKQASRSWNLRFNEAIQEFGFIRNEDEPCVYKKFSGSIVSFLILYVDDILIIGNDIPTLQSIKTRLSSCFSMKDLGEAAYILGVKIYRDRSRRLLGLSQSTYIDKMLKWFSMEESKRGFLPMRHGISLSKEMCPSTPQEREQMSQIPYASAIGSIMYAMICTRPDLSYALSMTSRYQANPGEGHWTTVKNILKYLRRTKDVFLVYGGKEELGIKGYTKASFQTDDDSRSQSGFVFCLNKDTQSHNIRHRILAAQPFPLCVDFSLLWERGCAIFSSSGKEFPDFLALLFIWVNYVEVETILSWRLRIQELTVSLLTLPPEFDTCTWISGGTKNFIFPLRLVFTYNVPTAATYFHAQPEATAAGNRSTATQPMPSANPSTKAGSTEELHFSSDDENDVFDWQSPRDHLQTLGPTPSKPAEAVPILSPAPTLATSAIAECPTSDSLARRKGKATAGKSIARNIPSSPDEEEQVQ